MTIALVGLLVVLALAYAGLMAFAKGIGPAAVESDRED